MKIIIFFFVFISIAVSFCNSQEIFDAVNSGNLPKVRALVEKDSALLGIKDNAGNTPLHAAAINGSINIAEYLLSKGADINSKENRGYTSLHFACHYNNENVAVFLIEKGARVDIKENRGLTPIFLAARNGNLNIIKLLIKMGSEINPVIQGIWVTPLSWAAENGFHEVVDYLLEKGAPADEKNNMLIRFSVSQGLTKLFKALQEKGANFDIRNNNGGTTLHYAAEGGSPEILKYYIDKGLEINKADRYGFTPLHYSAYNDKKEAVSYLIKSGANINLKNLSGQTPLNIAMGRSNPEISELLKTHTVSNKNNFPFLKGKYFGQKEPKNIPELFAPGIVSSIEIEHGNITISPDGMQIFWTSSYKPPLKYGKAGNFKVWSSKMEDGKWTQPKFAFFTKNKITTDDVPFIAPDGNRIVFMSRRSSNPDGKDETKENYWYIDRSESGWKEPKLFESPINDFMIRWQISISKNYVLVFGASRPEGNGGSDIYASKFIDGRYVKPDNLGDSINTKADETAPFIAPDESYIIFGRESRTDRSFKNGLYVSYKKDNGSWTNSIYLGDEINQGGASSPYVTPDGKYLFFNSGRNGNYDIYWVSAKIIEDMKPKR